MHTSLRLIKRASRGRACCSDSHSITWPLLRSDSPWPGIAGLQYCNITMWHSAQHWRHCVFLHTLSFSQIHTHQCTQTTHTHTHVRAPLFSLLRLLLCQIILFSYQTLAPDTPTHTHTHAHPQPSPWPFSSSRSVCTLETACSLCLEQRQMRDEARLCIRNHRLQWTSSDVNLQFNLDLNCKVVVF